MKYILKAVLYIALWIVAIPTVIMSVIIVTIWDFRLPKINLKEDIRDLHLTIISCISWLGQSGYHTGPM
jgi:hypothetical protein